MKGGRVTAYIALDTNTRRIEGTARMNGHRGFTYHVDAGHDDDDEKEEDGQ